MDYLTLLILIPLAYASIHILISKLGIKTQKSLKLPPGPRPLPLIGNILELGTHPHKSLTNLSQTYGPIISLKLGTTTTIVVSSPQLAKEVLQKHDQISTYRKVPDVLYSFDHHIYSMGWMQPSPIWKALRKICATKIFSSQQLDSTQELRKRKVLELMDFVKEKCNKGEAMDIGDAFFTTVLNSISNTFFSIDLTNYTLDKSHEFKEIIFGITEEAGKPNIVDIFPILKVLDPQGARTRMTKYFKRLFEIFDGIIEERLRLRALDEVGTKTCEDVLDSLLEVMLEENSQVSRNHVLHLLLVLFVAGIDTTTISIEWAMAELLRHPEKLKKVKNELQHVLGKAEKQLCLESHIQELPYLRAVIKETFRLHPPAPLLVPHKSENDVELCGYMVPKDAQVLVNVWAMGRDSSIWTNPNKFMPERFLENEIDFKGQHFELIPFGSGRRMCPGLPLSYRTIHVVLASLLLGYDWQLPNGLQAEDLDMSEKFGLTLHMAKSLQAIPIKA